MSPSSSSNASSLSERLLERHLGMWSNYTYFWNSTFDQADEFTSQLKPASDVSVHSVMSSLYFNAIVFVFLLASYEVLRRLIPSVYAARKLYSSSVSGGHHNPYPLTREASGVSHLPYGSYVPLDWVGPVFGVSWSTVRKTAGLDAYFFLRFIRMCVRITAVSTFWAAIILAPTYATGHNGANGWYHISMTNIETGTWRMVIPVVFIYLFSAFTFFVLKQNFVHWMELRMDFLGRGSRTIDPQHHFSLMVENIPMELRSDSALRDYFEKLFPGKIHSASVIMNLPDLETLAAKRLRITGRLEKAIAIYHATGVRPTHTLGQRKMYVAGIDCGVPLSSGIRIKWWKRGNREIHVVEEEGPFPPPGSLVDSISVYVRDLAEANRELFLLQKRKSHVGITGQSSRREDNWLINMVDAATEAASTIMDDSEVENDLTAPHHFNSHGNAMNAENMTSRYGSFGSSRSRTNSPAISMRKASLTKDDSLVEQVASFASSNPSVGWSASADSEKTGPLLTADHHLPNGKYAQKIGPHIVHPASRSKHTNFFRRWIGRLGLDFLVAGLKYLSRQLDLIVSNAVGTTMSTTGFVTFLDLTSVATASSTPLTHKPNTLTVSVAPEPRDIRWNSAHIPQKIQNRREVYVNIFLSLGIILWSIPLTGIQAFATAEQVARIPGMDWVLKIDEGKFTSFINGYLPVVALLTLIMLLPIIFEVIAVRYENRKTVSDVQRSMLGRYFYYQLANIYLTVTAGSFWNSLADTLDHPGNILEILGRSLPKVVGYFISLLITKILAGLPIIVLRVGALSRMVFLRSIFSKGKLTQREMDGIFRRENLLYGWEYPGQLLVIVICFTYACICPIILPFGAIYFVGSLMVYKKQCLYVYIPNYESGGALFPDACGCMLFGLLSSQLVLIGYTVIRQCFYEPLMLTPLPFLTIWVTRYFRRNYGDAAMQLSLERAVERDRVSDVKAARQRDIKTKSQAEVLTSPSMTFDERREKFDHKLYRQPVLTATYLEPMSYRRNKLDPVTEEIQDTLQRLNDKAAEESISPQSEYRPHRIPENFSMTPTKSDLNVV